MKRMALSPALAMLLLLCAAFPAAASPDPAPARAEEPSPGPPGDDVDTELAEAIQDVMVVQAKRRIGLSDEQARDVGAIMRRMGEVRREHQSRRREGLRTLAAMAEDSTLADDEIERRIESLLRADDEFMTAERRLMGDIRARLDTRQQARWMVFNDRFRDELRRRVEDARQGRRGGPGMRRPGRPAGAPPPEPPPDGGERVR